HPCRRDLQIQRWRDSGGGPDLRADGDVRARPRSVPALPRDQPAGRGDERGGYVRSDTALGPGERRAGRATGPRPQEGQEEALGKGGEAVSEEGEAASGLAAQRTTALDEKL